MTWAVLCLACGMLSGINVNATHSIWYETLQKPSFMPPEWIFGPVWTVLYITMGIGFGRILNEGARNKHLVIAFIAQFILNIAWSPLFFYLERLDLALYDIYILWANLVLFLFMLRKKMILLLLFLPYGLWVSFALILSQTIYNMNHI